MQPSIISTKKKLSSVQLKELLTTLKSRFDMNMGRHQGLEWTPLHARLKASPDKLISIFKMEASGGEPDVVGHDMKTDEYLFYDCSPETPKGRVSVCYDREGLESRKDHRPENTAMDMAAEMGVELLTEGQYLELQKLGEFDKRTSSWVKTTGAVRRLGGALYGERRYGRIFVGHNGAQSYYAARGFRGSLRI